MDNFCVNLGNNKNWKIEIFRNFLKIELMCQDKIKYIQYLPTKSEKGTKNQISSEKSL